jgi:hypothetical protein
LFPCPAAAHPPFPRGHPSLGIAAEVAPPIARRLPPIFPEQTRSPCNGAIAVVQQQLSVGPPAVAQADGALSLRESGRGEEKAQRYLHRGGNPSSGVQQAENELIPAVLLLAVTNVSAAVRIAACPAGVGVAFVTGGLIPGGVAVACVKAWR